MSNLIKDGAIAQNDWQTVVLPASNEVERKQAGKVVLFKLTGEASITPEQIAETVIPASGKVLVPLAVWLARKDALLERLNAGELGIWLHTHEALDALIASVDDLNQFPILAIFVERAADGRIFSLGTLLRTRHSFNNELRAFGDVLRDQLFFLKRSGFTSYLIRADRSAEDALKSLKDFTTPYQGAVDGLLPAFKRNRGAV